MAFGKGKDDSASSSSVQRAQGGSGVVVTSSGGSGNSLEAFLGKGSKLVGNITFSGTAEIDGYVEGEVNAKGRLEIGESAVVKAKVLGSEVVVRGTVNGDIAASDKLFLMKPAKVVGNITSANLSIEEGVVFEGSCTMKPSSSLSSGTTDLKTQSTPTKA